MKSLPDTADLQVICGLYRNSTGRSEARISDLACANPYLFKRLRDSKGCTIATYNRVLAWFSDNWPEGLQWPADIPRPPPTGTPSRPLKKRAVADQRTGTPVDGSGGARRTDVVSVATYEDTLPSGRPYPT